MKQPADRTEVERRIVKEVEIARKGRTAGVLESYAKSIDARDEVCIDSDLPHILRRAAELLREYCPETALYEKRIRQLREMV